MGSLPQPTTLRVAVLECDIPPGKAKEKYGGYGEMFRQLLEKGAETMAVDKGFPNEQIQLDVTKFDVVNHEHYPQLENIDAVLLTGSKYNSFDNDPWILKLVEFTEKVLAQDRVKLIGVCFGHQIVGRAIGVEVGRNPVGWETSVAPQQLTDAGKELFEVEELCLHQMHRDIVVTYPSDMTKLGHTPRTEVPAMYTKGRLITVQGHPEFNGEIVADITQSRYEQGLFTQQDYDDAISRVHLPHHGAQCAYVFIKFLLHG